MISIHPGVFLRHDPVADPAPVLVDVSRSGREYPPEFRSPLPFTEVHDNVSMYVEELCGAAPRLGATLLFACFPNTFIDTNRSAADVDESLIDEFGLRGELGKKLNDLSGGTKQKINAVAAFLFAPKLLILDEPTAGLDPRSSSILKDRIARDRKQGTTFIITSHIMAELEELADDVIFIGDGRVRFSGSIREIIALTRQVNLERAIAELMDTGAAA